MDRKTYNTKRVHYSLVKGFDILLEHELSASGQGASLSNRNRSLLTRMANMIAPMADANPVWEYGVNGVLSHA